MKALITGGAGFIGSHIAEALYNQNIEVHVIDNLSSGRIENVSFLEPQNVYIKDILDYDFLNKLITENEYDYIFHLAAMVSVNETVENPLDSNNININSTLHLLEMIRKNNKQIKKFIFASSAAVYGDVKGLPKSIEDCVSPQTPYAVQKYAGERYTKMYNDLYNLPTTAFRFFNVYGPKQNPTSQYSGAISIINQRFIEKKEFTFFGDGNQTRDFIYIKDLVDAILLTLPLNECSGEIYNIGTGKETKLKEVFKAFSKEFNFEIPYKFEAPRAGDIKYSYADISSLLNLGFKPKYNIEKGIKEYINYNK